MEHYLPSLPEQLIQLVSLNQKASAVVGFVIATPLVLLLAIGGLQLTWLLILQNQLDRAAEVGARELTLLQVNSQPEKTVRQYLLNAPFKITDYEVKVTQLEVEKQAFQTVVIEVPVKLWVGASFSLRAISYVP